MGRKKKNKGKNKSKKKGKVQNETPKQVALAKTEREPGEAVAPTPEDPTPISAPPTAEPTTSPKKAQKELQLAERLAVLEARGPDPLDDDSLTELINSPKTGPDPRDDDSSTDLVNSPKTSAAGISPDIDVRIDTKKVSTVKTDANVKPVAQTLGHSSPELDDKNWYANTFAKEIAQASPTSPIRSIHRDVMDSKNGTSSVNRASPASTLGAAGEAATKSNKSIPQTNEAELLRQAKLQAPFTIVGKGSEDSDAATQGGWPCACCTVS
jgi:hypothetical protein